MVINFTQNELKYIKIHERLIEWGTKNLREFPWRKTQDPYKVFIAEILLHRTKADQVEKIYNDFIKKYPDFQSICKSTPEKIVKELFCLGLSWRSKYLHEISCQILRKYGGKLPTDKEELLKLPGVGPYIASAFLCFTYGSPEPMLDTNIVRVIGRVFGLEITDSSRRNKKFKFHMRGLIELEDPRLFVFSLLDFAEAICKPKHPLCENCPLNNVCYFYKAD